MEHPKTRKNSLSSSSKKKRRRQKRVQFLAQNPRGFPCSMFHRWKCQKCPEHWIYFLVKVHGGMFLSNKVSKLFLWIGIQKIRPRSKKTFCIGNFGRIFSLGIFRSFQPRSPVSITAPQGPLLPEICHMQIGWPEKHWKSFDSSSQKNDSLKIRVLDCSQNKLL